MRKAVMIVMLAALCLSVVSVASASSMAGVTPKGSAHVKANVGKNDTTVYSNGGLNGTLFGWTIGYYNYSVADTFTLTSGTVVSDASYGSWNFYYYNSQGNLEWDKTTSINFGIGTCPTCDNIVAGTANTSDKYLGTNGYALFWNTFNFAPTYLPAGTYWLHLGGAQSIVAAPSYWDVNGGPSAAWESYYGYLPGSSFDCYYIAPGTCSESFSISGPSSTPEPGSLMLLGSGLLGLGGIIRRRLGK